MFIVFVSCIVGTKASSDNLELLDSGWSFRRNNEVEMLVAVSMVKELGMPWIQRGKELLADPGDVRWSTKEGLYKRLGRVVNLASGIQEAVIHDLMYKQR